MNTSGFKQLWKIREFNRIHFPFIDSLEDWDVLLLIGLYQERGDDISLKDILCHEVGSAPTVERRIARMKTLGLIQYERDRKDRRRIRLRLHPNVAANFHMLGSIGSSLDYSPAL